MRVLNQEEMEQVSGGCGPVQFGCYRPPVNSCNSGSGKNKSSHKKSSKKSSKKSKCSS